MKDKTGNAAPTADSAASGTAGLERSVRRPFFGKTGPQPLQLLPDACGASVPGRGPGQENQIHGWQELLILPEAFAYVSLDPVSASRQRDAFLGNRQTQAGMALCIGTDHHRKKLCLLPSSLFKNSLELARLEQTGAPGEARPGIHRERIFTESAACGPWRGGGQESCGQRVSPCGRGNHACAHDGGWTAGMCVS